MVCELFLWSKIAETAVVSAPVVIHDCFSTPMPLPASCPSNVDRIPLVISIVLLFRVAYTPDLAETPDVAAPADRPTPPNRDKSPVHLS